MLRVSQLNGGYERVQILWDVSLSVEEGEVVAIIGPNGAGKTTLLNTICGIIRPFSGSCRFKGEEISGCPSHVIASRGISLVPEGGRLFPLLTVRENLELGALRVAKRGGKKETLLEDVYGLFPVLRDKEKQAAGTLSGGEQQMLAIARALMSKPSLLLLDEPSLGLAPTLVASVFGTLREIKEKGDVTLLLVEQNIAYSLSLADRGYVLINGRIVLADKAEALLDSKEVKKSYLGL